VSTTWLVVMPLLVGFVAVLAFVVLGLLRRLVPLMEQVDATLAAALVRVRVSGLPAGAVVPEFHASVVAGAAFSDENLRGRSTLVLFINSSCSACHRLFSDLRAGSIPDLGVQLIVVTEDDDATALAALGSRAEVTVVVQRGQEVAQAFDSDRTPHAFVLDADGRVQVSGWPNDWVGLQRLLSLESGGGAPRDRAETAAVA
jgi:hypothetical protein